MHALKLLKQAQAPNHTCVWTAVSYMYGELYHILRVCLQHGTGKPSPWRVRGAPPLRVSPGPGPGPSQAPDSEDINAAMAAAGDLAAFFPSTQAEPEADASNAAAVDNTAGPSSTTATAAAATEMEEDGTQAIPQHAAPPAQPSGSTGEGGGHDPKAASDSGRASVDAGAAQHQQDVAATAQRAGVLSHAQPDGAEALQAGKAAAAAAAPRQTSRRGQSGRKAASDHGEEQEDQGSGRGQGRGRGKGARGGVRGRGRKRGSADAAAADEAEEPQPSETEVTSCCLVVSEHQIANNS